MHILVIDDEASIRHLVKLQLELDGQTVETAADGATALALQETQTFDLIVLDLMLPDTTGFDLIPKLRKTTPDLPILMLTARDQMNDKIIGLQLGADDYMTKPFNGTELVLRVKNLLKRIKTVAPPMPVVTDPFLSVDPEERVIRLDGQPLPLTYREYALLALFLTHPKRVFERDELLEQVWGFDFSGQTRAVDIMVQRLRKKLGAQGERIKTIYGVGYKWVDA
ncbi:XRE family transcriptional regulator [Exiguobacterium indicum]|uniref:XRE family transcriptional regulator n=1 Tax=Exiguobacterium indicum TaxID=296995 RepID=A0A0V8GI64_9BACL|nr:response regulator transcription factor [Exiguobacterium enclense]KSU49949.1 XRE family transcriptional regulator [Exiguobacterium enclense]SDB86840.1 DNA-binding response regulator, OmpR family, contains REC and winged-helix (wHTH) domain [Exiguobacterium enclense]